MTIFRDHPQLLPLYLTEEAQVCALVSEAIHGATRLHVRRMLRGGYSLRSAAGPVRVPGLTDERELWWAERCAYAYVLTKRVRLSFDPARPFLPWFLTITRHLMIESHRAGASRLELPGDDLLHHLVERSAADTLSPEDQLLENERVAEVARAAALLAPREREVFELRHRAGLKLREVAERTGLSISKILTSERRIADLFLAELGRPEWEGVP